MFWSFYHFGWICSKLSHMWEPSPQQFSSKLIPSSSHLDLQWSPHTQIIRLYVQVGVQVSFSSVLIISWLMCGEKWHLIFLEMIETWASLYTVVGCTIAWVFDRAYKLSVSGRLAGYVCEGYMMPSFVLKVIFWLALGKVLFGTGLLALMVMPSYLLM